MFVSDRYSKIRLYVATDHCTIFSSANHAYVRIYINVAYSVYFRFPASSILGLGLGLVVGLGSVLVLFFYCSSSFPMYVKRRKISITASCICGSVVECLHVGRAVRVRLAVPAIIFLTFFCKFFFNVFCKLRLALVLVFLLWWLYLACACACYNMHVYCARICSIWATGTSTRIRSNCDEIYHYNSAWNWDLPFYNVKVVTLRLCESIVLLRARERERVYLPNKQTN